MKPDLQSIIYFLVLLAYVLRVVLALRCFKCESDISWMDCDLDEDKSMEECPVEKIRCASTMVRPNPREKLNYEKDCADRLHNPCHEKRVEDCRSTFCDSDLCNFALTPSATLIASGFRCFRCNSTKSWNDCVDKAEEIFCNTGYRKCFKWEFKREDGVTEYLKGCTVPQTNLSVSNTLETDRRDMHLCGQHLCNEAIMMGPPMVTFGPLFLVIVVFLFDSKSIC